VRARLGLAAEGSPILRLLNKDGELRAIMGLTADGTPVLQFMDAEGDPLWTAPGTATVRTTKATPEPAKSG
jgi:hypothetical protein